MNNAVLKIISRLLIVSMMLLSMQTANAGMIGTEQMMSAANAQSERAAVLDFLGRAEVTNQLQAMGLDPQTAKDRVAAMTDQEVHSLAGKIDSLPAGARHVGNGWWWALGIVIIAVIIYYAYNWK